jgi:hypothetical protein
MKYQLWTFVSFHEISHASVVALFRATLSGFPFVRLAHTLLGLSADIPQQFKLRRVFTRLTNIYELR